jgi:FixJ family two-component response regulator
VSQGPLVSVVDDDESMREALPDLVRELGFDVDAFASAEAFLASASLNRSACLIVDIAMPGMTGPELQRELRRRGVMTPIIFITAYRDRSATQVLAQGAVACLFKPFGDEELLGALDSALGRA